MSRKILKIPAAHLLSYIFLYFIPAFCSQREKAGAFSFCEARLTLNYSDRGRQSRFTASRIILALFHLDGRLRKGKKEENKKCQAKSPCLPIRGHRSERNGFNGAILRAFKKSGFWRKLTNSIDSLWKKTIGFPIGPNAEP